MFLSNISFTVIFLTVLCFCFVNQSASQFIIPISLNTSVSGTTSSYGTPIFTEFTNRDFDEDVGLAEQRVFQFNVTHVASPTHIRLTTCFGSSFDTYLVLFDQDPIANKNMTALSESANDLNCELTFKRAALHIKVNAGTYYVLLTGNTDSYGFYNLTLTSSIATPRPLPWHLDRIDQRTLPLDKKYQITDSAGETYVYLFDSGVNVDHEEFEGRVELGYDFVRNTDTDALDCTGHGTHTAALIGGRTYGVAKKVRIISVRVYSCDHTAKTEAVVNALNWVLVHSKEIGVQNRCVIALMVPLSKDTFRSMDYVIGQISRRDMPIVVPAGDDGQNACETLPEIGPAFLTVGAMDSTDRRAIFSNGGPCVDLYAPGVAVESAWHSSNNAVTVMSGTAQAAAVITGAVALMRALNTEISGAKINNILFSVSTIDIVKKVPQNDTARLVYVRTPPVYKDTLPMPGYVFLLTTLRAEISSCASSPRKIGALQQILAEAVAVDEHVIETRCTGVRERYIDKRSMSVGERQTTNGSKVAVQIAVGERAATSTFIMLERAIGVERLATEKRFGFSFIVDEMPWAIDSRSVIYWGAPTFPDQDAQRLTTGVVVAIVLVVVLVFCSVGVFVWLCHRRITNKDEILSMEGSADLERGPVHFKDFDDDISEIQKTRSFRNFKKALSFRQNSTRDSSESGGPGINSLRSFLSRGNMQTGGDVMRLQSFGGEAFANMMQLDRQESSRNVAGPLSPGREMSIRGSPRAIGRLNSHWKDDGSASTHDLMAVRSMGGEAFAGMLESPKP